jgi:hypothetical protein
MAKTGVLFVGFCLFQLRCRGCIPEKGGKWLKMSLYHLTGESLIYF